MYKDIHWVWIFDQFMSKFHEVVSRRYIMLYFSRMSSKYQLYSCSCCQIAGIFLFSFGLENLSICGRGILKSMSISGWGLLCAFSFKSLSFTKVGDHVFKAKILKITTSPRWYLFLWGICSVLHQFFGLYFG